MKKKSYFSDSSIYFIFLCIYYINAQSIVQSKFNGIKIFYD